MWRTAARLLLAGALAGAAAAASASGQLLAPTETKRCVAALFCLESRRHDGRLELWLDARVRDQLTLLVSLEIFAPRAERHQRKLVLDRPGRRLLFAVAVGRAERPLFAWDAAFHPGARPRAVDPAAIYRLPFTAGERYLVLQGAHGPSSHRGRDRFAVDWRMPVGTLVRAARGGRVLGLFEDSAAGGPDARWRGSENFLWIEHADGSIGWYAHFRRHGILVEPGQQVSPGDPLGYSGGSGYASEPHLHFQVSTPTEDPAEAYRTVPLRFLREDGRVGPLQAGQRYRAPGP